MDISFLRENYKDIVKTQGLEDNILKRFLKAHSKHPNVGFRGPQKSEKCGNTKFIKIGKK